MAIYVTKDGALFEPEDFAESTRARLRFGVSESASHDADNDNPSSGSVLAGVLFNSIVALAALAGIVLGLGLVTLIGAFFITPITASIFVGGMLFVLAASYVLSQLAARKGGQPV